MDIVLAKTDGSRGRLTRMRWMGIIEEEELAKDDIKELVTTVTGERQLGSKICRQIN